MRGSTRTHETNEMNQSETYQFEVEAPPLPEGDGFVTLGKNGEMTSEAIYDRFRKQEGHKERNHFRKCIPCDRCGACIILKGFNLQGKVRLEGCWCDTFEMSVEPDTTCDRAYRSKNGKMRVLLNMNNAPRSVKALGGAFAENLANSRVEVARAIQRLEPAEVNEYLGGGDQYKRLDSKEGTGKATMPRRLAN